MSTPTGNHHTTTMAISESNSSRGDQLVQLYQLLNLPDPLFGGGGDITSLGRAPPLVRPTATAAGFTDGGGTAASGPATGGRAGKAARRRTRPANRRTPTTVLTTDAVNFRAMVQQFTGAHQAPFRTAGGGGGGGGGAQAASGFGLGGGVSQLHRQPCVFPFGVLQQQQLHRNEERPLSAPGGSGHRSTSSGGDAFLRRIAGEPQLGYADVPAGFLPENVPPSQDQMTPRTAASPGGRSSDGLPFW